MDIGRKDVDMAIGCDGGAGRLPDHQIGLPEYVRVFVENMEMTLHDGIATVGAHTVGHVHPEHSGFGVRAQKSNLMMNPNTNAWSESPDTFDNGYFLSLVLEPWTNVISADPEKPDKNFWIVAEDAPQLTINGVPDPNAPLVQHFRTIMLNADMVISFLSNVDAKPVGTPSFQAHIGDIGELCGPLAIPANAAGETYGCLFQTREVRDWDAGVVSGDVTAVTIGTTLWEQAASYFGGFNPVDASVPLDVAGGNTLFLADFSVAYRNMCSVGYGIPGLKDTATSTNSFKLGQLESTTPFENYWGMSPPCMGQGATTCNAPSDCCLGLECSLDGTCVDDTSFRTNCFAGVNNIFTDEVCEFDWECCNPGQFCLPSLQLNDAGAVLSTCQFGGNKHKQ
jgi:hypothetical protein